MRTLLLSTLVLTAGAAGAGPGDEKAWGWRATLDGAPAPGAPVRGRLQGEAFRVERAELTRGMLTLREGKEFFAEREVVIFTFEHDRPLEGRYFDIMKKKGFGNPHVHVMTKKQWKNGSRSSAVFTDDYAMRLQFGKRDGSRLPGRIYLCLPDPDRSYVVGTFVAEIK